MKENKKVSRQKTNWKTIQLAQPTLTRKMAN